MKQVAFAVCTNAYNVNLLHLIEMDNAIFNI